MLVTRKSSQICLSCQLCLLASQRTPTRTAVRQTASLQRRISTIKALQSTSYGQPPRRFHSASTRYQHQQTAESRRNSSTDAEPSLPSPSQLERTARKARNQYGETLPENHLSQQELDVYERLYGAPIRIVPQHEQKEKEEAEEAAIAASFNSKVDDTRTLFRTRDDGKLEPIEYSHEDTLICEDVDPRFSREAEVLQPSDKIELEESSTIELSSQIDVRLRFDEPEEDEEDPRTEDADPTEVWPGDEFVRTHPLTKAGRFSTYPSTLQLPQSNFVQPVSKLLSAIHPKHLTEAAEKNLGGVGLPYSPSTPKISRTMEQKPVGLSAAQSIMKESEADAFLAAVMPQVYASAMSILVETRKRLGSTWLRGLLKKEKGPLVLDAGGGGAGVVAWREVLRAEWDSMHDEQGTTSSDRQTAPQGRAIVLTGSETLRYRASRLLENTTFLPRLPELVDYSHTEDSETSKQGRKQYDVIIASHLLWPLKDEHTRKTTVQTLWNLLNPSGGVLIILEKGVPRGFEVVAGARQQLLSGISSPADASSNTFTAVPPKRPTEAGMLIAPCTNHAPCPLYASPGVSPGRKDWCHFSQRYIRPPYLQRVLGARARNHDDAHFSFVAALRGRDLRRGAHDPTGVGFAQGEGAAAALAGFEKEGVEHVNLLAVPRALLPPLKRKGLVLLDVCTPAGTLERWVVNRRCGRRVYRDARKARWGDLWALGARSRTVRRVRLGRALVGGEEGAKKKRKGGKAEESDALDWDGLSVHEDEALR